MTLPWSNSGAPSNSSPDWCSPYAFQIPRQVLSHMYMNMYYDKLTILKFYQSLVNPKLCHTELNKGFSWRWSGRGVRCRVGPAQPAEVCYWRHGTRTAPKVWYFNFTFILMLLTRCHTNLSPCFLIFLGIFRCFIVDLCRASLRAGGTSCLLWKNFCYDGNRR